jgi:ribonuclease HI
MATKHYAVRVGKTPGIYTSWPECSAQVTGYPGAVYKSFKTREEALTFLYGQDIPQHEQINLDVPLRAQQKVLQAQKTTIDVTRKHELDQALVQFAKSRLDIVLDPANQQIGEAFNYGQLVLPRVAKCAYHDCDRRILETHPRQIVIYIDGSKRPTVNHRGSGAYCRFGGKDYYQSVPFNDAIGHRYGINPEDFAKLSSPTMEYLGLAHMMFCFRALRVPVNADGTVQIPNPRLRLIFVGDYNGVKHFTEGTWTAKEDYIIKIRDFCQAVIRWLQTIGVDVQILNIPGHAGILGNELADILAKSPVPYDSMLELIENISKSLT